MSLYIENASDKPFVFTEEIPSITITRIDDGAEILQTGWIADNGRPITVEPHSTYRLDDFLPLVWDLEDIYQIPPRDYGNEASAIPGTYRLEASFVYPYLESEALEITIEQL
jgi:hypothetical protein